MEKNLFCYKQEKDITEAAKASEQNTNCEYCEYLTFCNRDLLLGENGSTEKLENTNNKVFESSIKKEDENNKLEMKAKTKTETKPKEKIKKSTPKKKTKPSLDELAEMDDIF